MIQRWFTKALGAAFRLRRPPDLKACQDVGSDEDVSAKAADSEAVGFWDLQKLAGAKQKITQRSLNPHAPTLGSSAVL